METIKTQTAIEAAEILFDTEDDQFSNEAGYVVDTPEELAELLEKGQDIHTTTGERFWFRWESSLK